MKWIHCLFLTVFSFLGSCQASTNKTTSPSDASVSDTIASEEVLHTSPIDTSIKTIHIFVALCDNKYQGIVPVPAKIGNGQDPGNNLYWGCAYGIKTYFKNSKEWMLVQTQHLDSLRLERIIWKHKSKNYYLIADAYDGQYIKQCTIDFLKSSAGMRKDVLNIDNQSIGIGGHARLVAYIGHDGLMDFTLTESYKNTDEKTRDVIILACYSKHYFSQQLQQAKINPLVWSTGLMSPEAYTIHDALSGYVNNDNQETIRTKAAMAYSKYQKCSINAAKKLLVTGW